MSATGDIVTAYLKETQVSLVKSYRDKGLRASGRYEKGLTISVNDSGKKIRAYIESEGYVYFMQSGRKPNKKQDRKTLIGFALWATDSNKPGGGFITKWLKDKGIFADNPFGIAYNIGSKGISVPNQYNPGHVVTDIITDEWYDKLIEKIGNWHVKVIESEVSKMFK
jgi:hypothetical protein